MSEPQRATVNQSERTEQITGIATTLGRMDEKLTNIEGRLSKHESSLEKLTVILTGDGGGDGLAHRIIKTEGELRDLKTDQLYIRSALAELQKREDAIVGDIRDLAEQAERHPSLIWLMRFRTKQTITWIVLAFMILSLWWISGWRQPILELLGLPVF